MYMHGYIVYILLVAILCDYVLYHIFEISNRPNVDR